MNAPNPMLDTATVLAVLRDTHLELVHLKGLIEALHLLEELGGPRSEPIFAVVASALPLVRKITGDIERIM